MTSNRSCKGNLLQWVVDRGCEIFHELQLLLRRQLVRIRKVNVVTVRKPANKNNGR